MQPILSSFSRSSNLLAWCFLLGTSAGRINAASVPVSGNLDAPTLFTETAQGQTWVGAPFRTDVAITLAAVGLLLIEPIPGQLAAATSYWVVLRSLRGIYQWAFTGSNAEPVSLALFALGALAVGITRFGRSRLQLSRESWRHMAFLRTALPFLLPALTMAAATSTPISIIAPKHLATVRTAAVQVSVKVDPALIGSPLKAELNGTDVSSFFSRSGHCDPDGCPYTATLSSGSALRGGHNTIQIRVGTRGQRNSSGRTSFDWLPAGAVGNTATIYLPPAIGFSTISQGGGSPWISIYSNQGVGTTTTFPQSAACTTTYQVLALNRADLTLNSYNCYDSDGQLTNALRQFTAKDNVLVVAGTTSGKSASKTLDTTPIGGTNYADPARKGDPRLPYGYMVVGVSAAPAGQAYESSSFYDPLARADGLLSKDKKGNYNFHPSDFVEFKVRPYAADGLSSSITVGDAIYTPPPGERGMWLLVLDRRNLSSDPGCALSPTDPRVRPNCGTFYETAGSDSAKNSDALAARLKGADQDQLLFLVSRGDLSATGFPTSNLADAINNMGGSGYTIGHSNSTGGTPPYYTLISSNDNAFQKTLTSSAIVSTNIGDGQTAPVNGQSGFVKGMLGRDINGLYRPLASSQETAITIDDPIGSTDFSAYPLFWSQPVAWPLMDTPGRVAAYNYLSYQLIKGAIRDATGVHLDDLRFYYTGEDNYKVVSGDLAPLNVPPPPFSPEGQYCWSGPSEYSYTQPVCFTKGDMDSVATQLDKERSYMSLTIGHFAGTGSGRPLRDALAGNTGSIAAGMFSAMATVQKSIAASDQVIPANPSKWLRLAGAMMSAGSAANPAFGVAGAMLNVASQVTSFGTPTYSASVIPSAFSDYETNLSDLTQHTADYIEGIQDAFDISLDNLYSDWGKLSGVYAKLSNTDLKAWYFADQTQLDPLQDQTSLTALQYFYLQLLPAQYAVDVWPAQPAGTTPFNLGTMHQICNTDSNGFTICTYICDKWYARNPMALGWSWQSYTTPGQGQTILKDIFVIGGAIRYDPFVPSEQFPSQDLLTKLFDPQGELALPRDLFYAPNGPLNRRLGIKFSNSMCYK